MIAKEHISMLANGKACGRRYRVRCLSGTNKAIRDACTGKTVDVKVIGSCEKCNQNELVLSQEAFAKIARLALGRDLMIQNMDIKIANKGAYRVMRFSIKN
ncbi:putative EG45-like domain containing protein, plant [Helianthus annuus]|nr:putative EG45-like domain containing protein, plant [Helianthus annuus]